MKIIKRYRARVNNIGFDPRASQAAFCAEMARRVGVAPPSLIDDGGFHDIRIKGGPKVSYFYREEFDHAYGWFGEWRTGNKHGWTSRRRGTMRLSDAEYRAVCQRIDEERRRRKLKDEANRIRVIADCRRIWLWSSPARATHPYLVTKGIQSHGVRLYHGKLPLADVLVDGSIIVPAFDNDEELVALQFIGEDGVKRSFGPIGKGHFWIGTPRWKTLCVAEGFATGASVYEVGRYTCCCAFGAGGLTHAAQYVRKKFDPRNLIIVADGDDAGRKNAHAAARASDALVFQCEDGLDFNDMVKEENASTQT